MNEHTAMRLAVHLPTGYLLLALAVMISPISAAACNRTAPAASTADANQSRAAESTITLTVFAAASLTGAFEEIGEAFEARHTGVKVLFNFAGSQQLAQQIAQGAPADVFASANQQQMDVIILDGRIAAETDQPFVINHLVVIVPRDNPASITSLRDLAQKDLRLVLAAEEVPAGQYSLDFLDKAAREADFGSQYRETVLANTVSYEDNIKAVLSKVSLGEADAGIVYSSDVSGELAAGVIQIGIPDSLNVTATYPIAPLQDSSNLGTAQAFIEFVLSPEGQNTLAKYGFIPVRQVEGWNGRQIGA